LADESSAITQKQYSTGDPWTIYLGALNGWIDLSTAYQVKLVAKVSSSVIGPVTTTVTTTNTFTATTAANSTTLTAVSSFTGITDLSTITGPGIPTGTTVDSFNSTAGTITLTNAATASAVAVSVVANKGMATYLPVTLDVETTGAFKAEVAIHWDNTSTLVTIVPSTANANPMITIDPNLLGAPE
jgi:hypothetical protein